VQGQDDKRKKAQQARRSEESLEGAVVLAEAIGYCRSLKTLSMSSCRVISAEGWDVLLREGVAKSVSLRDLKLSCNGRHKAQLKRCKASHQEHQSTLQKQ
jgi:hypothetical protein